MNGQIVRERIKQGLFSSTSRIAMLTPDDPRAIEVAYLTVFTSRPTPEEAAHFEQDRDLPGRNRAQWLEDLYWALINSERFSCNH